MMNSFYAVGLLIGIGLIFVSTFSIFSEEKRKTEEFEQELKEKGIEMLRLMH